MVVHLYFFSEKYFTNLKPIFTLKDLIQHVKESHDGQIFTCDICKKEFASVKILQRHMSGRCLF